MSCPDFLKFIEGAEHIMDEAQQQQLIDDISDEEVLAFIALVEERLVEKLIRAIENAAEQGNASRSDARR